MYERPFGKFACSLAIPLLLLGFIFGYFAGRGEISINEFRYLIETQPAAQQKTTIIMFIAIACMVSLAVVLFAFLAMAKYLRQFPRARAAGLDPWQVPLEMKQAQRRIAIQIAREREREYRLKLKEFETRNELNKFTKRDREDYDNLPLSQ
jgi:hypothetical protein